MFLFLIVFPPFVFVFLLSFLFFFLFHNFYLCFFLLLWVSSLAYSGFKIQQTSKIQTKLNLNFDTGLYRFLVQFGENQMNCKFWTRLNSLNFNKFYQILKP
jgi:hypothetical protein